MAARLRKTHQEDVKQKIQAVKLLQLLQDHAFGTLKYELSDSRRDSAKFLLNKSISNAPTELAGEGGGPLTVEIVRFAPPNPE